VIATGRPAHHDRGAYDRRQDEPRDLRSEIDQVLNGDGDERGPGPRRCGRACQDGIGAEPDDDGDDPSETDRDAPLDQPSWWVTRSSGARTHRRMASTTSQSTGAAVESNLRSIVFTTAVAGRTTSTSFPPLPNQSTTFIWDARDAFGRLLQGGQPAILEVAFEYPASYGAQTVFEIAGNGATIGGSFGTNSARPPLTVFWRPLVTTLNFWDNLPQGLGGWDLDVHHSFDVSGRMLRFGDGSNLTQANIPGVIQTVAGNGSAQDVDGVPASLRTRTSSLW
jgi:hypothetical protein